MAPRRAPGPEGRVRFCLAPEEWLRGGRGVLCAEPPLEPTRLGRRARPSAHAAGCATLGRALRAARGPPSGAAADHRAAGWLSLCPSPFRVGETQVGAARREEPSLCHQKRIVRAWAEIETNSHGVIRAPTPFSAASILKNKMKPRRLPDAGAPRPAAVQPRPGGAGPAPPRARTSPPSMKLSRPLAGTGVPRGQWDGAGARGSRPCGAREAGAAPGRGERASSRGADGGERPGLFSLRGSPPPLASAPRPPPPLTPADPQLCWVPSFCRRRGTLPGISARP